MNKSLTTDLPFLTAIDSLGACWKLPAAGLLLAIGLSVWLPVSYAATSYDGNRWFQIEISIFSNEDFNAREAELWTPEDFQLDSLNQARRLDAVNKFFMVDDFDRRVNGVLADPRFNSNTDSITDLDFEFSPEPAEPIASGPFPFSHDPDLKFFDFSRDAFLQLPESEGRFQQTNRNIDRSADHRLLFYGLWRQPVLTSTTANTLYIDGGRQYGDQMELQGTITIRFNRNQDRVVIDTNLLFAEFGLTDETQPPWTLPTIPASLRSSSENNSPLEATGSEPGPGQIRFDRGNSIPRQNQRDELTISRVYQLKQSRDMRSEEFHYLDHPALGVVIQVSPYDLPPLESEVDVLLEPQGLEDFLAEPLAPIQ